MLLKQLFIVLNKGIYHKSVDRYFCRHVDGTTFYNVHGVMASILINQGIGEWYNDIYGRDSLFLYDGVKHEELPGYLANHFNMTPVHLQKLLYLPKTESWRAEVKYILENPMREYNLLIDMETVKF